MLASVATTIAALGALWFTNQSLLAANREHSLAERIAITDRFQKAVEQLASDNADVRVAGIYMLERVAQDAPSDHRMVFEVLTTFVRTHTKSFDCDPVESFDNLAFRPPVDIQVAMRVIGRRDTGNEAELPSYDLGGACLAGLDLRSTNFAGFSFDRANLFGAYLHGADLAHTDFLDADLSTAALPGADLTGANLYGAKLQLAWFGPGSPATPWWLGHGVRHPDVPLDSFGPAILDHADLTRANLRQANLRDVDLSTARLTTIYPIPGQRDQAVSAIVEEVAYSARTRWPEGFEPPQHPPG